MELDPAVLDIIHSVLARRRRVKPVKLPGFYRRLQSQQPQARGSLAPRAWNIHHKALPLSCGETCTSAQHADRGVDRMAICEDTRESWSTQRNAAERRATSKILDLMTYFMIIFFQLAII